MRHVVTVIAFVLLSSSARAQSAPVCDTFTDAEIADLLGKAATVKRSILGPQSDCTWGITGLMLTVNRVHDEDPEVVKAVVDARAHNPGGDTVKPEAGIGDAAVSVQGQYGRSAALAFRAGKTAWIMTLEKVDQKLDLASVLPKLRALAKKAATTK
jgi:hypothetical protein